MVGAAGVSIAKDKEGPGLFIHSVTGQVKYFDSHPGEPSQWRLCDGDCGIAVGQAEGGHFAAGYGFDYDYQFIPFGVAGGLSAAGSISMGEFEAFAIGGSAEGETHGVAGGYASTDAFRDFFKDGDTRGVAVGSSSYTYAPVSGQAHVAADGENGIAGAHARFFAVGGQITADGSALSANPYLMDSEGGTFGIAAQGSVGYVAGEAGAISGPDYTSYEWEFVGWNCGRFGCWPDYDLVPYEVDSLAGAGIGARLQMRGHSESISQRYLIDGEGYRGEGVRTDVAASTQVSASERLDWQHDYEYSNGLAGADNGLRGGYIAAGGAMTASKLSTPTGFGTANASGFYVGASSNPRCDFNGAVNGFSTVEVYNNNTMNGTVVYSGAGMSVTATNGPINVAD